MDRRANTILSKEELNYKKHLKLLLKIQSKLRKFHVRLQQATFRNDTYWIHKSQKELNEFYRKYQQQPIPQEQVQCDPERHCDPEQDDRFDSDNNDNQQCSLSHPNVVEGMIKIMHDDVIASNNNNDTKQPKELFQFWIQVLWNSDDNTCVSVEERTARTMIESIYDELRRRLSFTASSTSTMNGLDHYNDSNTIQETDFEQQQCQPNGYDDSNGCCNDINGIYSNSSANSKNCYSDDEITGGMSQATDPSSTDQDLQKQQQQKEERRQRKIQTKLSLNEKSRFLCKNMTKGTQTEAMFHDYDALIGYTRVKFVERSTLIVQSLFRLVTVASSTSSNNNIYDNETLIIAQRIMHQLLYNTTTVGSIGCGPGCDGVGLWSFLHGMSSRVYNDDDDSATATNTVNDDTHPTKTTTARIKNSNFCNRHSPLPNKNYYDDIKVEHQQQERASSSTPNNTSNGNTVDQNFISRSLPKNGSIQNNIQKIIFMDYTMPQWSPIVQCVKDIMIENHENEKQHNQHQQHHSEVVQVDEHAVQQHRNSMNNQINNGTKSNSQSLNAISNSCVVVNNSDDVLENKELSTKLMIDLITCDVRQPINITIKTTEKCDNDPMIRSMNNISVGADVQSKNTTHNDNNSTDNTNLHCAILENNINKNGNNDRNDVVNHYFGTSVENNHNNEVKQSNPSSYNATDKKSNDDMCDTIRPASDNKCSIDIVIVSYLLSETRDKWQIFMDDLINFHLRSNAIVLLSDPTAWQLHIFRQRYIQRIDFMWLDSSMLHPRLQSLEGRVGPAVLIGIVK